MIEENEANTIGTKSDNLGLDLDKIEEAQQKKLVLIIDDDIEIINMLKLILIKAGFNVSGSTNGLDAIKKAVDIHPDAILLDLMMPDMDGWEVIERLQNITDVPILMISAFGVEDNVAKAFDLGAEDFVKKPFFAKEVVARVRAALRRNKVSSAKNVYAFPKPQLLINLDTRQVWLKEHLIKLSPMEFSILVLLADHAPKPVQYEIITDQVWGEDSPAIRNRLKFTIHSLRNKLDINENLELIVNHMNYGYQLDI